MGSKFGDVSEKGNKSYWVLFDPEKPGSLKEYLVDSCCLEEIRKLKTFDMLLVAIVDANRNKKLKVQTNYSTEIDAAQREYSTSYFSSEFKCYTFPTDEKKRKECETLRKDYGMLAFIEDNLNNPLADVDRAKKYLEDRGFPTIVKALTNKQQGIPLFGAKPSPAATSEETRNIPSGPESNILKTLRYIRAQQAPISLYQEHVDPYAWEIYNAQENLPSAPPMEGVTIENKTIAEGEKVAEVRSDLQNVISQLHSIMFSPRGTNAPVTQRVTATPTMVAVPTAPIVALPTSVTAATPDQKLVQLINAINTQANPDPLKVQDFTSLFLTAIKSYRLDYNLYLAPVTLKCMKMPYAASVNRLIVPYDAFTNSVSFRQDAKVKLSFDQAPVLFTLEAYRNVAASQMKMAFGINQLSVVDASTVRTHLSLCSSNANVHGLFIAYMCYRQALTLLNAISDSYDKPDFWTTFFGVMAAGVSSWFEGFSKITSTKELIKAADLEFVEGQPTPLKVKRWYFESSTWLSKASIQTLLVYAERFIYYVFNMVKLYVQLLNSSRFIGSCSYVDIFQSFAKELSNQFIAILNQVLNYLGSQTDIQTSLTPEMITNVLTLIKASHDQAFVMVDTYTASLRRPDTDTAPSTLEAKEYNAYPYDDKDYARLAPEDCRSYATNVDLDAKMEELLRCNQKA
jgi:hypothetical protein